MILTTRLAGFFLSLNHSHFFTSILCISCFKYFMPKITIEIAATDLRIAAKYWLSTRKKIRLYRCIAQRINVVILFSREEVPITMSVLSIKEGERPVEVPLGDVNLEIRIPHRKESRKQVCHQQPFFSACFLPKKIINLSGEQMGVRCNIETQGQGPLNG